MSFKVSQYHFFPENSCFLQYYHFCLFQLISTLNLLGWQMFTFYCPLRKNKIYSSSSGDIHTYLTTHLLKRLKPLLLYYYTYVIHLKTWLSGNCFLTGSPGIDKVILIRLLLNCEKHKQRIQLCYGACNQPTTMDTIF